MKNFTFLKFTFIYFSLFLISNKASILEQSKTFVIGAKGENFENNSQYVFLDGDFLSKEERQIIFDIKDQEEKNNYLSILSQLTTYGKNKLSDISNYAGKELEKKGQNLKEIASNTLNGLAGDIQNIFENAKTFLNGKTGEVAEVAWSKYYFNKYYNVQYLANEGFCKRLFLKKDFLTPKDIERFSKETNDFLEKIKKNKQVMKECEEKTVKEFSFKLFSGEEFKKNANCLAETNNFDKAFMNIIKIKNGIINFNDHSIQKSMEKAANDYIEIFKKTAEKKTVKPSVLFFSGIGLGTGFTYFFIKNKQKIGEGFNKFFKVSKNEIKNSFGFLRSKIFRK